MSGETRHLAAIMFTDVVGYSRLMAQDERRALELLRELRGILRPLIEQSHGTLHKEIGDGSFSSFASAVDAARCACEIQGVLQRHPGIELRIGLHVGDVVTEEGDIYGDGVNIAARIEPLAPPGGIALSDTVQAQIRGKLDLPLRSIGQPMLKNIGLPIEIFVCDLAVADALPPVPAPATTPEPAVDGPWSRLWHSRLLQWTVAYIALAFGLLQGIVLLGDLFGAPELVSRLAAVLLGWGIPAAAVVAWFHGTAGRQRLVRRELALLAGLATLAVITTAWQVAHAPPRTALEAPRAATEAAAVAQLAPNSVVVLPFENPGGRAEDDYLSEGFSDELRDQLSRVAGLRVVARGSSIAFRGRGTEIRAIAPELGVGTVIEGSLRKAGEQIRVTVRLIDGASGTQRWSEAYDRNSSNLLAVQQEVALAAARAIEPHLTAADIPKPQWQASVHDLMLLARSYQQNAARPQDQDQVIEIYKQVLAQDPQSASAHARLGRALMLSGTDLPAAEQHLRRALSLDPDLAEGYASLGFLLWSQFRKGGREMLRRALDLNPNDADVLNLYGKVPGVGRAENRDEILLRARELDPMSLILNADYASSLAINGFVSEASAAMDQIARRFPDAAGRHALSRVADTAGQVDEAVAWALESLQQDPANPLVRSDLAFYYARLGLGEDSRRIEPEPSLRVLRWEGRYAEIVARLEAQDLDEVDADSLGYLAFALQALGRHAEAIAILRGMGLPDVALDIDIRRWAALHHLATLFGSLQAVGENVEARRLAEGLDQLATSDDVNARVPGWGAWYWNACAGAVLGRQPRALDAFERSATAPNLAWLPLLRDSECFRSLRSDTRHVAAMQQLEARYAEQRERLPQTLARHGLTGQRLLDAPHQEAVSP